MVKPSRLRVVISLRVSQIRGFAAMAPPEEQRPGILCEYAHAMGNR